MILNFMLNFDILKRFWEKCVKICSSLVTLAALGLYFISSNKNENNTELLKIYKFSFKIPTLNGDIKKISPYALEMILGKKYFALIEWFRLFGVNSKAGLISTHFICWLYVLITCKNMGILKTLLSFHLVYFFSRKFCT